MADRKATIEKIERIRPHPNADALEFADVLGYQCIVKKGQFNEGDLVVYIPEQTLVPRYILEDMNLWDVEKGIGKLAGSRGNRVKAVKLRGETSLGLLYPIVDGILCNEYGMEEAMSVGEEDIGTDVSQFLYIVKWEPEIPTQMSGEVCNLSGKTLKYDIENIKNHPQYEQALEVLGIQCVITEKLHGTWCCFGVWPNYYYVNGERVQEHPVHEEIPYTNCIVTSKGLSSKGLAFKDNEANTNNLYMKAFKKFHERFDIYEVAESLKEDASVNKPIYIIGEIYGKAVQDLDYGLNETNFRVFDVYIGEPGKGKYLPYKNMLKVMEGFGIETVPELYRGPIFYGTIGQYTDGKDSITGTHIREGAVIKPLEYEIPDTTIGRLILKSISDDYLNRKNATEYN